MKVLLVDFEDSFTWNIFSEVELMGHQCEVIHWREFNKSKNYLYEMIILGPGPGHVSEYRDIFPAVNDLLQSKKSILGICLGHQILCQIHGVELERLKRPVHGRSIDVILPDWIEGHGKESFKIQLYHSWQARTSGRDLKSTSWWVHDEHILGAKWSSHTLSYQFHPESVGTSLPRIFFRAIGL